MRTFLSALFVVVASSLPAAAQAPLLGGLGGPADYGSTCLYPNDDGSSSAIDITPAFPSGLRFFDRTHTQAFVNTNGNISFSGGVRTYTPNPFPVADQPMIAPYWADVDIRPPSGGEFGCGSGTPGTCDASPTNRQNQVYWHLEPGRMVVTWYETGYFSCNTDLQMSFQLILTAVPGCGGAEGDFDVEFRYNECGWETGDASGGTGGFGGTEAQAGFDAGNSRDFVEIPGSRMPGIAELLCTTSNVGEMGVWRFQIRSGTVLCPDAGEACSTGMVGVCAEGATQCVGGGTECAPVVGASDERCDSLDNDCDGNTDEGEMLCGSPTAVCDRGTCVDVCFEGGCGEGQTCTVDGRCVDAGCEDLECPGGQRCVDGACVGACEGVVCPAGQDCRGGRCLDLCEELSCDPECSVCERGACVVRCDLVGGACGAGETCQEDGLCAPTACLGVECEAGEVCQPGAGCVDACEGAMCPTGEVCQGGDCIPESMAGEDAGPGGEDGGVPPDEDAGTMPEEDAGTGEADAGRVVPRRDEGCGCAVVGQDPTRVPPLAFAVFGLALLWRRRG